MRAVLLTGHGGLEKLEYHQNIPVPKPGPGEVLIEVGACGMNNTDINTRVGWYAKEVTTASGNVPLNTDRDGSWGGGLRFPRIQGADPAGRIVAVGSGVDANRVGQRVLVDPWLRDPSGLLERALYLGSERDGGFADFVSVPAVNAHPIRSERSDVELASFPCSYSTAEHMLERARVRAGQQVLVSGASGGVGVALVQLAKRRGARVVALTEKSKERAVRALGAAEVFDRHEPQVVETIRAATGGIDVFADVVGGPLQAPLLEIVRRGGHYVVAGAIAGPIVPLDLRTLYLHDLTLHGATVVPERVFRNLIGYIERGEVRAVVAGSYPLREFCSAQEAFMTRQHVGTFVIDMGIDRRGEG